MDQLQARFPGVCEILETWFEGYKGPGKLESKGFGDRARAQAILDAAIAAFGS